MECNTSSPFFLKLHYIMVLIVTYKNLKDKNIQVVGLKIEYSIIKLKISVSRINVILPEDELKTINLSDEIRKIDRL